MSDLRYRFTTDELKAYINKFNTQYPRQWQCPDCSTMNTGFGSCAGEGCSYNQMKVIAPDAPLEHQEGVD